MNSKIKIFIILLNCILSVKSQQNYIANNIEVISNLKGNGSYTNTNKYYSCATWYQPSTNREYLIYNASDKIYFTDITNPAFSIKIDSFQSNYVPFKHIFIYKNYCYATNGANQIYTFDLSTLPNSVTFIAANSSSPNYYNSVFIGDKMFSIMSGTNILATDFSNPLNPASIHSISTDIPRLTSFNFLSARNDTLFASCGTLGFFLLRFDTFINKFSIIDSVSNNNGQNVFSTHCVLNNFLITDQYPFYPDAYVYFKNNGTFTYHSKAHFYPSGIRKFFCEFNKNYIISYNNVGLFLYDMNDISAPNKTGNFSSFNTANTSFNGIVKCVSNQNGTYIIVVDNIQGIFILDPQKAIKKKEIEQISNYNLNIFPNPANTGFNISLTRDYPTTLNIFTLNGISVYRKNYTGSINDFINTTTLQEGAYILKIDGNEGQLTQKLIITH